VGHTIVSQTEPGTSRRGFYLTFIYGIWGLISAALAAPALLYLLLPPKVRRDSDWIEAADMTQFHPNVPVEVVFRKNHVDGWKINSEKESAWVVKLEDQRTLAFGPQCTHLGCAYHWDDVKAQFICPCHNSIFGIDGRVVSGPAPRPLDRFDTKIESGKLLLGALHKSTESKT